MKKSPKEILPKEVPPEDNLKQLLSKYDNEKKLLLDENLDLEKRIIVEIQENHQLKQLLKEQEKQLDKMQRELAGRDKRILLMEAEQSDLLSTNVDKVQNELQDALRELSETFQVIKENEGRIEKLEHEVSAARSTCQRAERTLKESKQESVGVEEEMKHIQEYCEELKEQSLKLKEESERMKEECQLMTRELEELAESHERLENKYNAKKKKYKELESLQGDWEIRQRQVITEKEMQLQRVKAELTKSKEEFDRVWKDLTSKNTTIEFQKLQLSKKEELLYNEKLEEEEGKAEMEKRQAELTIKCSTLTSQNARLIEQVELYHEDMARIKDQMRSVLSTYDIAYKMLKEKIVKEIVDYAKGDHDKGRTTEEVLLKIDKVVEQVKANATKEATLLKLKDREIRLEQEIKQSKEVRSKSRKQENHLKQEPPLKLHPSDPKRENELLMKDMELSLMEKEVNELKASNEGHLQRCVLYQEEIQELERRLNKADEDSKKKEQTYTTEIQKVLEELYEYKDKALALREVQREETQLRELVGNKMATFERRIKQLNQSVERKEELIDKLKHSKREYEQVIEVLQENLKKLQYNQDLPRKLKADLSRKDQLMSSYRTKYQSIKLELQSFRQAFQRLQKHCAHLQKELSRKASYINTLKEKYEKEMGHIEKKLKHNSDHTKSVSNVMENKLISIKKECHSYEEMIEELKKYLTEIVEQLKQTQLEQDPPPRKKKKENKNQHKSENKNSQEMVQNAREWQATKVLGLKESELQEFINPKATRVSRKAFQVREQELERIWSKGELLEYFERTIDYMIQIMNI